MSDLLSARTVKGSRVWPRCLAVGVMVVIAVGVLIFALNESGQALPLALAVTPAVFFVGAGVSWILLVDGRSLSAAPVRPQESVESHWYDRAVRGAFHDGLIVMGLGAFILNIWTAAPRLNATIVLPALLCLAAVDVAVRYLIEARR